MKEVKREITDRDVVRVLIAASGQNSKHPDIRAMKCSDHGEGYGFHIKGTAQQTIVTIDSCCDAFLDEIIQAGYQRSLKDENL